jgi:hypothetical protein
VFIRIFFVGSVAKTAVLRSLEAAPGSSLPSHLKIQKNWKQYLTAEELKKIEGA